MTLTNDKMIAGRFLRIAKGRKLFRRMNVCWDANGSVWVVTAMNRMELKPKHRDLVQIGKSGSLYLRRGKKDDCLDFCGFAFSA